GVTKNLGLTTGVSIRPQRQTALFAKQAADVDLFSDGRLRLGVGVGWNWVEYDGLEMSGHFRRRGKRQEQQIALIRKLWEQPVVDHEDSDHRIDRAGILPRPKRQIPIWLGGSSEAAYDRAARIGDGLLFGGRMQTQAVEITAKIEAKLTSLGETTSTPASRRSTTTAAPPSFKAEKQFSGSHGSLYSLAICGMVAEQH